MRIAHRSLIGASLALCPALAACSGGGTSHQDAGRDIGRLEGGSNSIAISPSIAFEGQRRFVGSVGPGREGDDLSSATISAQAGSGIVIESTTCTRIHCIVVGHIDDVVANTGSSIPEPTAGTSYTISVVAPVYNYTASLLVFPLDTADAAALGTNGITTDAVYSSLSIQAGATLRGTVADTPVRIAVLGSGAIHGSFDFAATSASPGPGGHAGGVPPMGDGDGPLPGGGDAMAGGGGGNAMAGGAGMGAGGAMGGAGGMAASDPSVTQIGGGSGGGAAGGGAGGNGGGALELVMLGDADFAGAVFSLRGGDAMGAGGGGAGGLMLLGGSPTGNFTVDLTGGMGASAAGAHGGGGSGGRLRLDGSPAGATVTGGATLTGVQFDLASVPPLVRDPMLVVTGTSTSNTHVRVRDELNQIVRQSVDTTSDASGHWTATLSLLPGVTATLIAYDLSVPTMPVPSLSGTTVVVQGPGGARQVYAAAVDVVYLPMTE